ncbi:C10 family peptidase [Prevotella dentasini]|uniref:C10 family peptidase n=1 Tax=Prevotella dentasini TaxID=589537 RepID=UPI00046B020A|nr:C10 family peptidase [Prevotella dentasini]
MNYGKKTLLLILLAVCYISVQAKPRSEAQIQAAISKILEKNSSYLKAPRKGALKMMKQNEAIRVYGYDQGGFVVVSTDDVMPAVLGYSDSQFNTSSDNPGFNWWLKMVEEVTKARIQTNQPAKVTRPQDPYPSKVDRLISCQWGQQEPFNNLCPLGTSSGTGAWQGYTESERTLTGCVATAMAQIMYYHKYPLTGSGSSMVNVDQPGKLKTSFMYDFENAIFDYDNMRDNYESGQYTEAQAYAVANLMVACGVACDMAYATDGSGSWTEKVVKGLIRNMNFTSDKVRMESRDKIHQEDVWMNLIYKELSENRPILYTAADLFQPFGHAFVLDGYNAEGQVRVNWGWNGDSDGFYDIATLNVKGFAFARLQDMCIGMSGENIELTDKAITLSAPGTLGTVLSTAERFNIKSLKLTGKINSSDFKVLREMAGRSVSEARTKGHLASLDLTDAEIVTGGEAYLTKGGKSYTVTADNTFPELAFHKCTTLRAIKMPKTLKAVGDGAFSQCRMSDITFASNKTENYSIEDHLLYNADKSEIIFALPGVAKELHVAKNVKALHPYSFAGNSEVRKIFLPSTVMSLGREAFSHSMGVAEIKTFAKEVPTAGQECFSFIPSTLLKLYVPKGMYEKFGQADQWKDLLDYNKKGIIEFGTTIKARNLTRSYGDENPSFIWDIEGDEVVGTPVITCEANEKSPAGKYTIKIDYGTVEPDGVELKNGTLVVSKAKLKVTAEDCERYENQENPVFKVSYEGFKNGEDENSLDQKPVVETDAVAGSPAGEYELRVSGAASNNYSFVYRKGKMTIKAGTGIEKLMEEGKQFDIYSLQGVKVKSNATDFNGLRRGIYIVNGKKVVVE